MSPTEEATNLRFLAIMASVIDAKITELRRRTDISDEMADALDKHVVTFSNAATSFLCFAQDMEWNHPPSPFCQAMRDLGVTIVRRDAP